MTDLGENMRKRSTRRATTYGVAAIVSLSLIAAACGGSSDDDADDATTGTEATDTDGSAAPDATDGGDTEPTGTEVVEGELEENVVTVAPDETPVPGGTLRYGLEADVDGLNPHVVGPLVARPDDGQRRLRHADGLRRRRRRRSVPRRVGRAGHRG